MKRAILIIAMLMGSHLAFSADVPKIIASNYAGASDSTNQCEVRKSIFCSSDRQSEGESKGKRHYRGIGGFVCMIFDGLGISYWYAFGILLMIIMLRILLAVSKTDHEWRSDEDDGDDVFDVGEAKEAFFTCIKCKTRHSRTEATRIVLHGNHRTVKTDNGKDVCVEANVTCRIPMCTKCENALYERARSKNLICATMYIAVFILVAGIFYWLYFTLASAIFFGVAAVIIAGIVRVALHFMNPRQFSISVDSEFLDIPGVAALIAHGFSIGKSHADIVEKMSQSN